jgi:hypothetical protein
MIRGVKCARAGQMGHKTATKLFSELKGTLDGCVRDNTKSLEELA